MTTIETKKYGSVNVRNVMIDTDGTNLIEGIEIEVVDETATIEIVGYKDIDEMTKGELERLIEANL